MYEKSLGLKNTILNAVDSELKGTQDEISLAIVKVLRQGIKEGFSGDFSIGKTTFDLDKIITKQIGKVGSIDIGKYIKINSADFKNELEKAINNIVSGTVSDKDMASITGQAFAAIDIAKNRDIDLSGSEVVNSFMKDSLFSEYKNQDASTAVNNFYNKLIPDIFQNIYNETISKKNIASWSVKEAKNRLEMLDITKETMPSVVNNRVLTGKKSVIYANLIKKEKDISNAESYIKGLDVKTLENMSDDDLSDVFNKLKDIKQKFSSIISQNSLLNLDGALQNISKIVNNRDIQENYAKSSAEREFVQNNSSSRAKKKDGSTSNTNEEERVTSEEKTETNTHDTTGSEGIDKLIDADLEVVSKLNSLISILESFGKNLDLKETSSPEQKSNSKTIDDNTKNTNESIKSVIDSYKKTKKEISDLYIKLSGVIDDAEESRNLISQIDTLENKVQEQKNKISAAYKKGEITVGERNDISKYEKEISDSEDKAIKEIAQELRNENVKKLAEIDSKIYEGNTQISLLNSTNNSNEISAIEKRLQKLQKEANVLKETLGSLSDNENTLYESTRSISDEKTNYKYSKSKDRQQQKEVRQSASDENNRVASEYKELSSEAKAYYEMRYKMATESNSLTEEEISLLEKMKRKYEDALSDGVSVNLNGTKTSVNNAEKASNKFLSLMDISSGKEYLNKQLNSLNLDKFLNNNYSEKFQKKINELKKNIDDLRLSISDIGDVSSFDNMAKSVKNFIDTDYTNTVSNASNEKLASGLSRTKLMENIQRILSKNTAMPSSLKNSYEDLYSRVHENISATVGEMREFNNELLKNNDALYKYGSGLSAFSTVKEHLKSINAQFISQFLSIQDFVNYGKELFNIINEIDTAMTELKRVTDLSSSSYDTLFEKATESAVNYGRTISETITSTASWVRLGFDADDAVDLSGVSAMYQNVTDLDEDTAVDNLVTAYKGFEDQLLEANSGDKVAAVTQITDVYDKLGNEFAESASDVGDGLSKAASVLSQAGADINEAAGLFTGINEVLQDSSTSGQALKIITLRIRGMSGELEELGEDVDDDVDSISKMQTQVLNLTHGKVNIFDDDGNFRNVYDILKDIANIYDELTSTEQASLLEKLAGKNRANALAALFSNWDNAEAATEAARNSSGTAEAENEVYMDSIDGRVAQFQARVQQLASDFASSDVMKGLVSVATEFITILDTIIDKLGSIPLIVAGIKTAIAVKDVKSTGNIGESFLYTFLGIDNEELRKKAKAKKLGVVDDDASGDIDVAGSLGNQQQSVDGLVSANDALINSENQVVDAMEHTINASGDVVDSLSEITDATDDASGDIDGIIDRVNGAGDNSEESTSGTGKKLMSAFNLVSSIATVAWGVGSTIYNAWKEYKENLLQQANETTEAWNTSKESIESYAEQYQNIKTQISTGELTEAEGMNQLYELQQQIVEEYGKATENVDLTNGSLSQQLEILKNISVEQARSNLSDSDNLKAYKDSEKEMTSKKTTNGTFGANTNDNDNLTEALDKAIEAANKLAGDGTLSKNGNSVQATFYGSVAEKSLFLENFEEEINTLKDAVDSEAGLTSDEKNSVREYYTQILADVQEVFSSVSDTVSDYGENYKSYLEQKLYDKTIESSTTGKTENMGLIMAEYSDALEAYKEGISTGVSDDELLVLKNDFEELNAIKEEFISNPDNAEFSYYFQDLDDSYDELMKSVKKNNFEKAIANGTNASSKSLKNLNKSVSEYKKNIRNISFGSDTFENVEKLRKATSTAFARLAKEAAEAGVIDSAYNTDDLETLIDYLGEAKILVKDASSITFDDAKQSLEDFTSDLSDAKTDLETLQTIMGESSSGTGVTSDNITAFKKLFGDDAQKAIERTTNGYHLNTEALKELQKKQEQLQKSTYYDALKDQYAALKNVNEQLILSEVAGNNDRVTSLTNERNELLKNIESIKDEQMAYEGLTSTFAKWKNAQSQSTEHDDYASLVSGLTTVDEEFQKGWFTSDQSRTYLDTLVSEDLTNASAEEIIAARAKLNQAIEGTTYKISDFLTKDSSGNATADGAVAMLEAIKQIYGDSIYTTDENGDQVFDFVGRDEEIANRLGMDVSGFQKILQALGDSGYVVNLDQPIKSIEELKTEATEAKASLDEVETTNEDLKGINLDSDNFSDIYEDMENVNSYIQEISDNDELDVDVKDDRIENANKLLAYMSEHLNELKDEGNIDLTTSWDENEVNDNIKELEDKLSSYKNSSGQIDSQYYDSEGNINDSTLESYISQLQLMIQLKNEYSRPTVLSIDTSEMDDEMASAVSLLNSYRDSLSLLEANKAAGVDTTEAEQKIASYKEQLDAIENTEIRTTLRLDYVTDLGTDSGTDAFDNALQQVDVNTVLNSDNVDNYNPEEKTATVTYTKNSQEPDSYEMGFALGRHNQTATITYTIQTQGATPSLTVGTSSGDSELNGTAHANGNWGTKKTETALVGELGREIVVDGKTGTWQTVGDNGAEFRKIPSGSIIFNHKQTEDLLKNGYVTSRGKAVSGSAWLNGTAYSSVGGKNLLAQARSVSNSSSTTSAASSASDAASSASDAAEDTSETMDYIEIKIDRIERIIDNLSTIAESEYNTYQKRNEATTEQIAKVREEIDIQQQAYDRYMQQANSVGLSEEYAQKIRDGLIDIEEITDETLKDNISDYQEWLVLATLHSDMHEKSYLTAGNP